MTTHVDDLLYSYLPEGKQYMDQLLVRYCGKQFSTTTDGITVDVSDNTFKIKPITIEQGRPNSDALQPHELSQLRSVVGSLSWIARQARPDLLYVVSKRQSQVSKACISILKDASKAVDLAIASLNDTKLNFPYELMTCEELGVLSVSDDFCCQRKRNEISAKTMSFLDTGETAEAPRTINSTFKVYPIAFPWTTVKRGCRATLQCETYSLQSSMEAGDRIRALIVEMKGFINVNGRSWEEAARAHCPQLHLSDCMSLVNHLNSYFLTKIQDKRLAIEMRSMRQSLRDEEENVETF